MDGRRGDGDGGSGGSGSHGSEGPERDPSTDASTHDHPSDDPSTDHDHTSTGHDHDSDDHDHAHGRGGHGHGQTAGRRALAIALAINTAFFLVEIAGALYAGSLALLADALHMLTDSASIGLALFAAWVAARPADARRTYGYQRAEVLGALANALLLLAVVGFVLFDAVRRLQDPQPVRPLVVVGVGVVGLAANLAAAAVLEDHRAVLNVEGAFLHLLADAAGSVAAIAVGTALLFTDLYVLDPLFALLIAVLVLYSMRDLLGDSLNILLQGAPRGVDVDAVRAYLAGRPGVVGVHDVHVWALSSTEFAMSAHVVVGEDADPDAVLSRCRAELGDRFGIGHATVQVESPAFEHTVDLECDTDGGDPCRPDGGDTRADTGG